MKDVDEIANMDDEEINRYFLSLFQETKNKDISDWFRWYADYEANRFRKFKELGKLEFYKPFKMEGAVEREMDGLIRTGHFDRIDRVDKDKLVIVEYKTGKSYDPDKEYAVSNVRAETQWYKSIVEGLEEYKDYKVVGWLLINPTVGKTMFGKFAPQTKFSVNKHAGVIKEMLDGDREAIKKYGFNCMYCDWNEECLKYDIEGHEIFGLLSEEIKNKEVAK